MTPKEVLEKWIDRFNAADAVRLTELYAEDAVNHQVANKPVVGKTAIHEMFANEFATAEMVCIVENIFEDGEWAIMEWKDQLGLRGCGFFHVKNEDVYKRQLYDRNDLLFAVGPAGSGKTYTAIALAVRALKEKQVRRIILTRPELCIRDRSSRRQRACGCGAGRKRRRDSAGCAGG